MISSENIYWAYSSAAQTVATFVALLLAGYAIVLTMMESTAQADETLVEIHESLKERYHKQLSKLAISTAAAIVGCLFVVYLNGRSNWWFPWLAVIAAILLAAQLLEESISLSRL
jgi:cell division protein FtsW (lipid II flippase)